MYCHDAHKNQYKKSQCIIDKNYLIKLVTLRTHCFTYDKFNWINIVDQPFSHWILLWKYYEKTLWYKIYDHPAIFLCKYILFEFSTFMKVVYDNLIICNHIYFDHFQSIFNTINEKVLTFFGLENTIRMNNVIQTSLNRIWCLAIINVDDNLVS